MNTVRDDLDDTSPLLTEIRKNPTSINRIATAIIGAMLREMP